MGAESNSDGTVGKALDVLYMVAGAGRPVRFTELLANSAFPKATLYRFLQTLTNQGMLMLDPDRGTYTLGVRLVRLAHAAWAQSSLAPLARPYLDVLSEETAETIHLAQMDQGQVLYVDKRNAARPVEMFAQAGKVGPAYCTGVGKAMLAYLSDEDLQAAIDRQSFHRFTPLHQFRPEKRRELFRAIADKLRALSAHAITDVRRLNRARRGCVQLHYNIVRRAGGRRQAEPGAGIEAFQPLLVERGRVTRRRHAL